MGSVQAETMKAVVFNGPFEVEVVTRPIPKIIAPTDAILKVSSTALCGSDLVSAPLCKFTLSSRNPISASLLHVGYCHWLSYSTTTVVIRKLLPALFAATKPSATSPPSVPPSRISPSETMSLCRSQPLAVPVSSAPTGNQADVLKVYFLDASHPR